MLDVLVPPNVLGFYSKVFPIINYDLLAKIKSYNNFLEKISRLTINKEKLDENFDSGIPK